MADMNKRLLGWAKNGDKTAYAVLAKQHGAAEVDAALAEMETDDGMRASAKEKNPFRKGPGFNVTEQGRIFRTDPALAARLASAAGTKIG